MGVMVAVVVGLLIGVAGAFVQSQRTFVGSLTVPWGVPLTLATLVLTMRAAVAITRRRIEAAVIGACWVLVSLVLSAKSPSGDLVISAASWSVVYLFGGVVLVGLAASLPPPRPRRPHQPPEDGGGSSTGIPAGTSAEDQ